MTKTLTDYKELQKHRRLLYLEPQELVHLFSIKRLYNSQIQSQPPFISVPTFVDLPEDYVVDGVYYDAARGAMLFVILSDSFTVVQMGEMPLEITSRIQEEGVQLAQKQ